MRLSYSLKKNIFEAYAGGLLNRLHLCKRRDTLMFIDILANYIKECEDAGYQEEIMGVGRKWMNLYFKTFVPHALKKIPPMLFLNKIMRRVWINLGLMDNVHFFKEDNIIKIYTKNEGITSFIGKNKFSVGLFIGVLNEMFGSDVDIVNISQGKVKSKYIFKISAKKFSSMGSKEKIKYLRINHLPSNKQFTLKDSLKKGFFILQGNKIYFRKRIIYPVENTIFHLLSNEGLTLSKIAYISYDYFKSVIKESSRNEKLVLLKTLLQIMGWGNITILSDDRKIRVKIKNPPYGLQLEKDNWIFLVYIIQGYLWIINKSFKIENIDEKDRSISVDFLSSN